LTKKEKIWTLEIFSDGTYKITDLKTGETREDKINPLAILLNLINLVFFGVQRFLGGDDKV